MVLRMPDAWGPLSFNRRKNMINMINEMLAWAVLVVQNP